MSAHEAEIDRMMELVWCAPDLATQTQLLNRTIEVADAAGDVERGWDLRTQIFHPACFSGQIDVLLLHFAWCIAQVDRDPERFEVGELLWTYKWVIDEATNFPQVPLAKLNAMVDDFAKRVVTETDGKRTIPYARGIVAICTFDLDEAERQYKVWHREPRDHLSDCRACEAQRVVELHANRHDDERAIESAAPMLAKKMTCGEVPHVTYGTVLLPALRLGRFEDAQKWFTAGFRLVDRQAKLLRTLGEHLQFLALTHNTTYALDAMARNIGNVIAAPAILQRIPFLLGSELLMRRLAGQTNLSIDFPPAVLASLPPASADGTFDADVLAQHFAGLVDDLCRKFDQRNGNTWLSDHAAHLRALLDTIGPHEVTQPRPRAKKRRATDEAPIENDRTEIDRTVSDS